MRRDAVTPGRSVGPSTWRSPRPPDRTGPALLLEGFCSRLAFGVLSFTLPLYAHDRGLSLGQIGLLLSFATLVSLLAKPALGPLVDRCGLRRSLLAALVGRSLLCLTYLATATPWQLFAVRGLHGLTDAARDPAVHALIAERGPDRSMATTFAWYQTAKTSAGALGKFLAGVLLATRAGFPLAFAVAFALSLLPVLAVAVAVPPAAPATGAAGAPGVPGPGAGGDISRRVWSDPSGPPRHLAAYALVGFLVAGTSSLLTSLLPLIATEYAGLSTAEAGTLYLLTPALALTGPAWGALADRVGRRLVLSLRAVANVSSALVLLALPTPVGLWTGKCLDDLGKAAFRPAWGSLMAELSGRQPQRRARTMGVLTAGEDAGDLAAPVVAAMVWAAWGVPTLLVLRIVCALLTEIYVAGLDRPPRAGRPPRGSRRRGARGPEARPRPRALR